MKTDVRESDTREGVLFCDFAAVQACIVIIVWPAARALPVEEYQAFLAGIVRRIPLFLCAHDAEICRQAAMITYCLASYGRSTAFDAKLMFFWHACKNWITYKDLACYTQTRMPRFFLICVMLNSLTRYAAYEEYSRKCNHAHATHRSKSPNMRATSASSPPSTTSANMSDIRTSSMAGSPSAGGGRTMM